MGDKKKSYVVLVLDESTSMGSMRDEAIDAFNQQLEDIRTGIEGSDISVRVGFIKFNSSVDEPVLWNKCASSVRNLESHDYQPRGMTAMLDGVGTAIEKLNEFDDIDDENTSVLMVIISDGAENNSKKFTYNDIAVKIQELSKTNRWTFTYSGANQDLSKLSQQLNIPVGNIQEFAATSEGMSRATLSRSKGYVSYFGRVTSNTSMSVKDFYVEDDNPQVKPPEVKLLRPDLSNLPEVDFDPGGGSRRAGDL